MPTRSPDGRMLIESALRYERAVAAALLVIALACWTWIAVMANDMYGAMDGASAWTMTTQWGATDLLLLVAMWVAMMTAMMLPSAAPLILLYAGAARARGDVDARRSTYAITAGYLVVWVAFSVAAAALQRVLSAQAALTMMMEPGTPVVAAALLAFAGLYQLTPLKRACLRVCRSPLAYLLQHSRSGAFALGARHGAYCLGCCWVLMLLLFAGGVMNLWVVVALTAWVLAEKFAPFGESMAKASGIALLALAAWMASH